MSDILGLRYFSLALSQQKMMMNNSKSFARWHQNEKQFLFLFWWLTIMFESLLFSFSISIWNLEIFDSYELVQCHLSGCVCVGVHRLGAYARMSLLFSIFRIYVYVTCVYFNFNCDVSDRTRNINNNNNHAWQRPQYVCFDLICFFLNGIKVASSCSNWYALTRVMVRTFWL